jgi:TPR repeat
MSLRAVRLNEKGRRFMDNGELDLAASCFQAALEVDPQSSPAWFNLGLIYKRERNWEASFDANMRAAALSEDLKDDPACWNAGIAATALRRWDEARRAWTQYGVNIPDGTGPIEMGPAITPIRIAPSGNAEVVWCSLLDPARARIENIPTPESQHRWHDIVLHDGVPNGERISRGQTYFVFDELERWEPSETPTLEASVMCGRQEDSEALVIKFGDAGFAAEDWIGNIRMLCAECDKGAPHEIHDAGSRWKPDRLFGIAAPQEVADLLLTVWRDDVSASREFEPPAERF